MGHEGHQPSRLDVVAAVVSLKIGGEGKHDRRQRMSVEWVPLVLMWLGVVWLVSVMAALDGVACPHGGPGLSIRWAPLIY